ncbi:conserved Plasmodium protein, unknown function [Plasmodium gaboni]|uniref:Deubiquitinating enzyme MINDY-3/4 conserved domain-containing protein n=1 Tax=Plasmodium gaboni TaxID=647221 RepID=A0ABY1UJZ3_9APIC|nr:conserved Plasmodium protein, unknown function [Plasmodium gaboni]
MKTNDELLRKEEEEISKTIALSLQEYHASQNKNTDKNYEIDDENDELLQEAIRLSILGSNKREMNRNDCNDSYHDVVRKNFDSITYYLCNNYENTKNKNDVIDNKTFWKEIYKNYKNIYIIIRDYMINLTKRSEKMNEEGSDSTSSRDDYDSDDSSDYSNSSSLSCCSLEHIKRTYRNINYTTKDYCRWLRKGHRSKALNDHVYLNYLLREMKILEDSTSIHNLVFGVNNYKYSNKIDIKKWCNHSISFYENKNINFGLRQFLSGPCGLISSIQGYIIIILLFNYKYHFLWENNYFNILKTNNDFLNFKNSSKMGYKEAEGGNTKLRNNIYSENNNCVNNNKQGDDMNGLDLYKEKNDGCGVTLNKEDNNKDNKNENNDDKMNNNDDKINNNDDYRNHLENHKQDDITHNKKKNRNNIINEKNDTNDNNINNNDNNDSNNNDGDDSNYDSDNHKNNNSNNRNRRNSFSNEEKNKDKIYGEGYDNEFLELVRDNIKDLKYYALVESLAYILYQCTDKSYYIVAFLLPECYDYPYYMNKRNCDENLVRDLKRITIYYKEFNAIKDVVRFYLENFIIFSSSTGVISFLYSVILTRGLHNVKNDMDDINHPLIGIYGHCSQELVNLLLTGRACSNVFDNNSIINTFCNTDVDISMYEGVNSKSCSPNKGSLSYNKNDSINNNNNSSNNNSSGNNSSGNNNNNSNSNNNNNNIILKGISKRPLIGLLTDFEAFKYCEVGNYYKYPIYPIWVISSSNHYTVLFSLNINNSKCTSEELFLEKLNKIWKKYDKENNKYILSHFIPQFIEDLNLKDEFRNLFDGFVNDLDILLYSEFKAFYLQMKQKDINELKFSDPPKEKYFYLYDAQEMPEKSIHYFLLKEVDYDVSHDNHLKFFNTRWPNNTVEVLNKSKKVSKHR